MSKNHNSNAATIVAAQPLVSVPQPASLRAKRIAAVQVALHAKRIADKQAKYVAVMQAYTEAQEALAKQQAYQLAVAQLQAQYGIAPLQVAPRANSATVVPSPSAILINGQYLQPCKAVHAIAALCKGDRKATLAMCKQHGINSATAATQYGVYKKQTTH